MQQLRDPEQGCPWDIEQDFKSIAPYTIEEAYEVADAIARDDLDELKDELGDLLLQVVFHSQMASEQDVFDFNDVVTAICDKMTRRHPHVFADKNIANAAEQSKSWEALKAQERAAKNSQSEHSLLASIPNNLPALARAVKLTKKAASVGFDWSSVREVIDKVDEELIELKQALDKGSSEEIEEEFGDLLFVLANFARKSRFDPASSLSSANLKFIRRFQFIENTLIQKNTSLADASLADMDALWEQAKQYEKIQK